MNDAILKKFMDLWHAFFEGAELPICFYFSNSDAGAEMAKPANGHSCLICELSRVRKGEALAFNGKALACGGAKWYLGFADEIRPGFEYFLSSGIPGSMEGERYKKTPEIVREMLENQKALTRRGRFIVFKRWDKLDPIDQPDVVVFFATPDVLAGLFTLANFDEVEPNGVIAPFGAGCGSIVHYPYLESLSNRPRAVIGLFDPSARPCAAAGELSFSIPMKKFQNMIANMEQSFLITPTWKRLLERIRATP